MFPMILDYKKIGVSRNKIVEALEAEGIEGLAQGYVNLHRLPYIKIKLFMVTMVFHGVMTFHAKIFVMILNLSHCRRITR